LRPPSERFSRYRHIAGVGSVHRLATQRAGAMQCVPVSEVLHDAPSAPAAEHRPARDALHVPAAGHTATLVGKIESAPQLPPAVASVSAMHLLLVGLQPT
jgi:hypothetical protein